MASETIDIRGPDNNIYRFPAGTPTDVINGAMRKRFGGAGEAPSRPALPVAPQETDSERLARLREEAMFPGVSVDPFGRPLDMGQQRRFEETSIRNRLAKQQQIEQAVAAAGRELGAPVQIGEAPFRAQMGAGFGLESSRPLEQMMPGMEFRTIEGEGPLRGQQVFRPAGSQEPFTTAKPPGFASITQAGAALPGLMPGMVGGGVGAALGTVLSPFLPAGGSLIGAGLGTAGGEVARQAIGRQIVGLSPLPPGMTEEQAIARGLLPARGAATREQVQAVVSEGLLGAMSQGLANAISGTIGGIRRLGVNPSIDPEQFRAGMQAIRGMLAETLGPEEAARAMQRMSAPDMAAAMEQGAVLQAQADRLRLAGKGDAFRAAEAEKERYLRDLSRRLLGVGPEPAPGMTALGQTVAAAAPEIPPIPSAPLSREAEIAALRSSGEQKLQSGGLAAVQELTQGMPAATGAGATQAAQTVAAAAPRGTQAVAGVAVNPEQAAMGAAQRADIALARTKATEPISARFENTMAQFGQEEIAPESLAAVAQKFKERLANRLFPSVSPEDQSLVNNFFARAQREVPGEAGAVQDLLSSFETVQGVSPGAVAKELAPRTLEQLRQDSTNLKAALRNANKGKYDADVKMLNEFIGALDDDILRLIEKAGGRGAREDYQQAVNAWKSEMDLFERTGRMRAVQGLRAGGQQVVSDERVAGQVFANPDQSSAVREALTRLPIEDQPAAIERVKSTLRWEIVRRAAPGTGEDVSPQAVGSFIRNNDAVLRPWFSDAELQQIQQQASAIANVRRAMGVRADQDAGQWFDKSFWNASPENVRTIFSQIRANLPATGANSAQQTIETLQNLTRQKIYSTYTGRGELGEQVFNSQKFFQDFMDDTQTRQFYREVFGPGFEARGAALAEKLSDAALAANGQVNSLRTLALTEKAAAENAARLRSPIAEAAGAAREMLRVGEGKFNPTAWADKLWSEGNAQNIAQITGFLRDRSPESVAALRNLTMRRIFYEITLRNPKLMKDSPTSLATRNMVDTDAVMDLVNDQKRREWLVALFRDPGDTPLQAAEKAYGQVDKILTTVSLLKPDQARAILTNATDPALVSIETMRRMRNVIFGPLNPKSRIATRFMEWSSDGLRNKAADALLDPEKFLALQRNLPPTPPSRRAAYGILAQPAAAPFVPDTAIKAVSDMHQRVRELFSEEQQ